MVKFSSQEIESQYNLIKTLLSNPEKYNDPEQIDKKADKKYTDEKWQKKHIDSL